MRRGKTRTLASTHADRRHRVSSSLGSASRAELAGVRLCVPPDFTDKQDLKAAIHASFKYPLFWREAEMWSAGKAMSFLLICGLIVAFEYAVLNTIVAMVLA